MSEVQQETQEATELKSQYAAQVTADLERNAKEQDRLGGEVAALQAQLQALQQDQALLVSVQQALGAKSPAGQAPEDDAPAATVPAPRSAPAKPARQKKAAAAKPKAKKAAVKKPVAKKAAAEKTAPEKAPAKKAEQAGPAQPTLGTLIHDHLSGQSEPRSAAEVTTALSQSHPERGVKNTVVRTTLEGLVAKGRVERAKQGTSVYYTATAAAASPQPQDAAGE
ncbi:BlaI/MecI/CopY family transcriptional regulator [Streptomyces sp. NPDC005485]|uniref:BlaI/MecI/CopY family transcriptional regulator n=1 Tax=Streptomyces sp. NPDC005485 TaxID=3155591 RepID=UPI0033B66397